MIDYMLGRCYTLEEIDGWNVIALVVAQDRQQWYYEMSVHKDFVASVGWLGVAYVFIHVQDKLTATAPPFDPTTIEWMVRPYFAIPAEEDHVEV